MCRILLLIFISLFFNSCELLNSSSQEKTAYFIDSAVSGAEYTCGSINGKTGINGDFIYKESCKVIFKIGGITLGEIDGNNINSDNKVLPADILGIDRQNTTNVQVVNLIQLLQSLDEDNNPNNNIVITQKTRELFRNSIIDFRKEENQNSEVEKIFHLLNKKLISKNDAITHYEDVIENTLHLELTKKETPKIKEQIVKNKALKQIGVIKVQEEVIEETLDQPKVSLFPKEEIIEPIYKTPTIDEPKYVAVQEEDIGESSVESEVLVLPKKVIEPILETKIIKEIETIIIQEQTITKMPEEIEKVEEVNETIVEVKPIEETQRESDISFIQENENEKIEAQDELSEVEKEITEPIFETQAIQKEITLPSLRSTSQNIKKDQNQGFSYENQRDVNIFISVESSLSNKQVLLYESLDVISTPVGDIEKPTNIIISTIFDSEGELNLTYTFGNHITSVWLIIPFYGISMNVPILDNHVYLELNK